MINLYSELQASLKVAKCLLQRKQTPQNNQAWALAPCTRIAKQERVEGCSVIWGLRCSCHEVELAGALRL